MHLVIISSIYLGVLGEILATRLNEFLQALSAVSEIQHCIVSCVSHLEK